MVLKRYKNVCACVCGQNELKTCITLAYPHIIMSYEFIPCYASAVHKHMHTHTHILKPLEDSELTGLQVDIASYDKQTLKFKYCSWFGYH